MCRPPPGRKGGDGDVGAQGTTSTQVPPGDSRIRGQAGAILLSDLGEQRQICIEAAGDEGLIACALLRRDALEDVNTHRTVNFVSVGRFRRLRTLLPVQVRRLWPRHCWHSGLLKKSDCKRVVRLCPRPRRRLWRLMRSTTLDTHRRPAIGANASIVTWRPAATTPPRPSTRPPRGPLFRRRLSSRGRPQRTSRRHPRPRRRQRPRRTPSTMTR